MSLASASLTFGALRTDVIPGAFLLLLLFQLYYFLFFEYVLVGLAWRRCLPVVTGERDSGVAEQNGAVEGVHPACRRGGGAPMLVFVWDDTHEALWSPAGV